MKKQIPNIITLCNLACGTIAAYCAATEPRHLHYAALFILLGIFFDFFDGLAARLLGVASALGKELDSLADAVTSGVAPGFILYAILSSGSAHHWIAYAALATPVLAAYRLAKFNLDDRQHHGAFLGLPAPANALIWVGLAIVYSLAPFSETNWLFEDSSLACIAAISVFTAILMITEMPMFSLKFNFKDLSWKSNWVRYIFLAGCLAMIIVFYYYCISLIILWYILLSLLTQKKPEAND